MKLNAPKQVTWLVALLLGLLGLLGKLFAIPVISDYAFWLVLIGFVLLLLGAYFRNL